MARTWGLSVLVCPRWSGPMRVGAVVEDPSVIAKILVHLGLPDRPPPRAPPWRPQQLALAPPGGRHDGLDAPVYAE